ncbi:hypothetical protein Syun_004787 [Stephania yunnanensis]|uniref:Uncharacterized protein n=1 Tax=Stephania yunnanensis TaxID=152371 RepID=A0AAP0Q1R7_9MAGN
MGMSIKLYTPTGINTSMSNKMSSRESSWVILMEIPTDRVANGAKNLDLRPRCPALMGQEIPAFCSPQGKAQGKILSREAKQGGR